MIESVVRVTNFSVELLRRMLADVPDEQMCDQPPGLPNHPAWLLGHLALVRNSVLKQSGSPANGLPEGWPTLFGRGSAPAGDRSAYPTKEELWGTFEKLHRRVVELLPTLTPEQLAGGHAIEPLKSAFPTLGDLLVQMLTAHDGLHIGQLSDWRRAHGLPRMIG